MRVWIVAALFASFLISPVMAAESADRHADHAVDGGAASHTMGGGGCRMCAAEGRMQRSAEGGMGMQGMGMSMGAMPMHQSGGMDMMALRMAPGAMTDVPPLMMLDLDSEQRQRIESIQNETRSRLWQALGNVLDAQSKLRALYAADTLDPKAIGAAYASLARSQQQVIEGQAEAMNRIRSVLTPAQREQLKRPPARMACGMMGRHSASPSVPSIKEGG